MVRIAGGTFQMGSNDGEPDEKPVHEVAVTTFDLDKHEVTVQEYKACVDSKKCSAPSKGEWSTYYLPEQERPVNFVDSKEAETYCATFGKRLPSEEEWEYAARGKEGRRFAWGDTPPKMGEGCWGRFAWFKKEGPCPVGSYPKTDTPDGLQDMTGNVWEWTSSGYSHLYEKPRDPKRRIYRGGSWKDEFTLAAARQGEFVERASRRFRNLPAIKGPMVGFRCAKDVEP